MCHIFGHYVEMKISKIERNLLQTSFYTIIFEYFRSYIWARFHAKQMLM